MSYQNMSSEELQARKDFYLKNREQTMLQLMRAEIDKLEHDIKTFKQYHPEHTKKANELLARMPRIKMAGEAAGYFQLNEEYEQYLFEHNLYEFWAL